MCAVSRRRWEVKLHQACRGYGARPGCVRCLASWRPDAAPESAQRAASMGTVLGGCCQQPSPRTPPAAAALRFPRLGWVLAEQGPGSYKGLGLGVAGKEGLGAVPWAGLGRSAAG